MSTNCERRSLKSPGGDSHDLFGAEFIGSPCHHRQVITILKKFFIIL